MLLQKFNRTSSVPTNTNSGQPGVAPLDPVAAIQQAVILALLDYNRVDLLTKYLAALGISGSGSLTVLNSWRGDGSTFARNVPPCVLIKQGDANFLAIGGVSDADSFWQTLATFSYRTRWQFDGHFVHAGMREMVDALYAQVGTIVGVVSRPTLCISGHSIGGAVANGVGFLLQKAERLLEAGTRFPAEAQQIMTFGAPRFFTNTVFNDDVGFVVPQKLQRVVILRDAVPLLPARLGSVPRLYATRPGDVGSVYANQNIPFTHIGETYWFNDAGRIDNWDTRANVDLEPAVWSPYQAAVSAAFYYFQVIRLWAQARGQISSRNEYGCQLVRYAAGHRDDEPEQPDSPSVPLPLSEQEIADVLPRRPQPRPAPPPEAPLALATPLLLEAPPALAVPLPSLEVASVQPPGADVNSLLAMVPGATQIAQDLFNGAAAVTQAAVNDMEGVSIIIRSVRRSVLPSASPGPSPPATRDNPTRHRPR